MSEQSTHLTRCRVQFQLRLFFYCLIFGLGIPSSALAQCLLCARASTFTEQIQQADVVVVAEFICAKAPESRDDPGTTTAQVRQVFKGRDFVAVDQIIQLDLARSAEAGGSFLALGYQNAERFDWSASLDVSDSRLGYFNRLAEFERDSARRLGYFLPFLESTDALADADAFGEFEAATYPELVDLAPELSRLKLRKWIRDPKTKGERLGVYGLLLGMCGQAVDGKLLHEMIFEQFDNENFVPGLAGMIEGYLLLRGDRGLEEVDTRILQDEKVPFSSAFAAMQAIRFLHSTATERVPVARLRKSMRLLVCRPEIADLAIADLGRMNDWEIQDQLVSLYGQEPFDVPSVKRAIVRYLLRCSKQNQKVDAPCLEAVAAAEQAQQHLESLRRRDMKTVSDCERLSQFLKP